MSADEQGQDYRIRVLREAGHEDAARLLEALPAHAASQPPAEEPEQEQPPQRPMTPAKARAAAELAQAQRFLDQINQTRGQWRSAGPVLGNEG